MITKYIELKIILCNVEIFNPLSKKKLPQKLKPKIVGTENLK